MTLSRIIWQLKHYLDGTEIMKVVILAAGRALSLGDISHGLPKCLMPFGDGTIISRQIDMLKACGVKQEQILIVTGYRSDVIAERYPENILYNIQYKTTDNAYSLYLALQQIDEDILLLDGDLVFDKKALKQLLKVDSDTLLVHSGSSVYGATGVMTNENNQVTEIGKHVTTGLVYDSMLYLTRSTVQGWRDLLCQRVEQKSWYTVSLNKLVKKKNVNVIADAGKVCDVDTYFDYIEAKRCFGIENFTIMVTGASGLLGNKIYHILKRYYQVEGVQFHSNYPDLLTLDLTDETKVEAFLEIHRPQIIIHTAGIADPEKCLESPAMAKDVNVRAVKNLLNACRKYGIKLIHVSTDYVFDGESWAPYEHEAARIPKNFYGELKKQAEDLVRGYENSLIVRLPILYGYNSDEDKDIFPIYVIKMLRRGKELYLDNKQIRYPVLIDEVALSLKYALRQTGILHITSREPCTKYTWAKTIAEVFQLPQELIKENPASKLDDRPPHIQLAVGDGDFEISDIKAGSIILAKQMHCVFRLIYKSSPASEELSRNVGAYRFHLGKLLASSVPKGVIEALDCVVPVPSSGMYYAMGLAAELGVPYIQGLLKPDSHIRSFQLADLGLRMQTIRDKIIPIIELIRGKNIVLVDEAIFTGVTLKVVCDMLKGCGVGKVYICIPTPLCSNHCQQYVQPERVLLSEELKAEEIKDYFGVEGVYFQDYDCFQETVSDQSHICYECFRSQKE